MQVLQTTAEGFPLCVSLNADTCVDMALCHDGIDMSIQSRGGRRCPLGTVSPLGEAFHITHMEENRQWVSINGPIVSSMQEAIETLLRLTGRGFLVSKNPPFPADY